MFHRKVRSILAVVAAAVLTVGCASLSGDGNSSPGAKTAIQFATLKYIDKDPGRASEVIATVDKAQSLVSNDSVTSLDEIEQKVTAAIDFNKMDTAEQLVVKRLVETVRVRIEKEIKDKTLDPKEQVAVKNILSWVREAAVMAGGDVSSVRQHEDVARHAAVQLRREAGQESDLRVREGPVDRSVA